jgi:DNA polymerase-4
MWERNPFTEDIPTAVSVVLFNLLQEKYVTLPVLESYRQVEKNKSLYTALDGLNRRYGYASVYFGGSHTAKYSAPMRIAFTQIPDLEVEDDEKKIVLKRKR